MPEKPEVEQLAQNRELVEVMEIGEGQDLVGFEGWLVSKKE